MGNERRQEEHSDRTRAKRASRPVSLKEGSMRGHKGSKAGSQLGVMKWSEMKAL